MISNVDFDFYGDILPCVHCCVSDAYLGPVCMSLPNAITDQRVAAQLNKFQDKRHRFSEASTVAHSGWFTPVGLYLFGLEH